MKFNWEEIKPTLEKYFCCIGLLQNKSSILDVFCGRGLGAALIAPFFEEVCGVDTNQENVEWSKRHLRNDNLTYSYFSAKDVYKIGVFEGIILIDSAEKFDCNETYNRYLWYLYEKCLINGGNMIFDYKEDNKDQLRGSFLTQYLKEIEDYSLFCVTKDFNNRLKSVKI